MENSKEIEKLFMDIVGHAPCKVIDSKCDNELIIQTTLEYLPSEDLQHFFHEYNNQFLKLESLTFGFDIQTTKLSVALTMTKAEEKLYNYKRYVNEITFFYTVVIEEVKKSVM